MSIVNVVALLGGMALFLYGITLMGDGLNKVAGNQLQVVLYRLTSNPLKGVLLGIGVTALIQSSSATSIMAVGFVNSGMMVFAQAASIILGSVLGTSITGWIVSLSALGAGSGWMAMLSTTFITGVVAAIGIVLLKFSKRQIRNKVGTILLGFAVLMFGMSAMSDAVSPLRQNEAFLSLLTKFENPALGILAGAVFTAILQSSSAAVGILQAISMTGALSFLAAYPIILGIAVGSSVPVLLSAVDSSVEAKRTSLVYLIINVLGAILCGIVVYAGNAIRTFPFMNAVMNPVSLALVNTVFRGVTVLLLAPFVRQMEKIAKALVREGPQKPENSDWALLEERFIRHPALAIEQCRIVLFSMAEHVRGNISDAIRLLTNYSEEGFKQVEDVEELVDQYEDKLGTYIVQVTTGELNAQQNRDIYQILHVITDLERISDHALNIAENAREIQEKKIVPTEELRKEMGVMNSAVFDVLTISLKALEERDLEAAYTVEPLEERIDNLCDEIKHRQIERMTKGIFTRQNSFVFTDLITNYERISDHCSNIALSVIEATKDEYDPHNYVETLMSRRDENFEREYQIFKKKYSFD